MHHACLAEAAWQLGNFGGIVWVHEVHLVHLCIRGNNDRQGIRSSGSGAGLQPSQENHLLIFITYFLPLRE